MSTRLDTANMDSLDTETSTPGTRDFDLFELSGLKLSFLNLLIEMFFFQGFSDSSAGSSRSKYPSHSRQQPHGGPPHGRAGLHIW